MYDLLVNAGHATPVPGNQGGSYLTMKSNQGLVFGAATILSGFAGIFCDQGVSAMCLYWISGLSYLRILAKSEVDRTVCFPLTFSMQAIASAPGSTTKAYVRLAFI